MKIANNLIFVLLIILISCKQQKNSKINNFSFTKSYINYNADTAMYKLNANLDIGEQTFMVVRKIFVKDSCFGNFSSEVNYENAIKYLRTKLNDTISQPYFKYTVNVFQQDTLKKLWDISTYEFGCDNIYVPVLDVIDEYTLNKKTYPLLRVIQKNTFTLNLRSLNFLLDKKNNWKLVSKEMITTNGQFNIYNGYCIDTITKNIGYKSSNASKNEINFIHAFDSEECRINWICNETWKK